MDKFVVRTPRSSSQDQTKKNGTKPRSKQATLHSLSGVVVIEDILNYKKILSCSESTEEEKVKILKDLISKSPSTKVLTETGIGKAVAKLRKGSEGEVYQLASQCYNKWKLLLEKRVELSCNKIQVQSDKETERLREASTRLLLSSLGSGDGGRDRETSVRLETHIFKAANNLVNSKYRRLSRRVIFALKSPEYRNKKLNREEIKAIVDRYKEK